MCLAGLLAAVLAASAEPPANPTELNNRAVTEAKAGRFQEAVELLHQALSVAPDDPTAQANLSLILSDWAAELERQGSLQRAIASLREAVAHDPTNGLAFVRLGDLLYLKQNNIPAAVESWQQANGRIPAPLWHAVADRISQAQRDQLIERGFSARQTDHFEIRYEAAAPMDLSRLESALEEAYARLMKELGHGPSKVTVLVYSEQDLRRLYNQRDWTIGFYDGRLRLRRDDIDQDYFGDLIGHELAHAFLQSAYGDRLPIWIHEGFAQLHETIRPSMPDYARIEQGLSDGTLWVPLKWLDRRFQQPADTEDVLRAYVEARRAVRELVNRYGMSRFSAFLTQLSQGVAVEAAYEQAFAPSRWARADQGHFD